MWTHGIVVPPPSFDDDLRFATAAEPLEVQALVAEAPVKALVHAVLPRLAWVDERGFDVGFFEPFQDRLSRAVSTPVKFRS